MPVDAQRQLGSGSDELAQPSANSPYFTANVSPIAAIAVPACEIH